MWMNVTCLVGRATADAKPRVTAGGTEYATIRVAVPRGRDETDFFTVECWGKLGKIALDHVKTGKVLSLRCELRHTEWGSGADRRERVTIVARKLGFVGGVVPPETEVA
jgi:single-stranded DNA-binding protein